MHDLALNQHYDLCYRVCPELHDGPFYLTRLPPGMPKPFNIGAYADTSYSLGAPLVRDSLIASNQWRGPGPTIVYINPPTLGVTMHELAHMLPLKDEYPEDREPTAGNRRFEAKAAAAWASGAIEPIDPRQPWFGHEADWIRYTFHVWWRATNLHGFRVHPVKLCVAGKRYGLSHARGYLEALGDEPKRLQASTFKEIQAIEPPAEFSELFEQDVLRWKAANPTKKEKLCQQ